tara:strand:+ start:464 stop:712 length:249 start_codon:yes stop_codon:yes gene_type:complete
MSFRKQRKKVKIIKLLNNHDFMYVEPKKGSYTLYWWNKGDDQNGWIVKADLYDVEAENIESLVADNLNELMTQLKNNYGLNT